MKRLLRFDWDAIAGIIAAVLALLLHFLHIVDEEVLLMIALVLIALLFIRDLRRERTDERIEESLREIHGSLATLASGLTTPDAVLVGPQRLRSESKTFCRGARGEMVWFHVCLLMFESQSLFDDLLRPAVENPRVTRLRFVLDEGQRELWQTAVRPKLADCSGAEKVDEPHWTRLDEHVSFILSDAAGGPAGGCLLSFWGEPFMARAVGRDVPRFLFHVQPHSELLPRLIELERSYRLSR
jgi:hypothetical protein